VKRRLLKVGVLKPFFLFFIDKRFFGQNTIMLAKKYMETTTGF